MDLKPFDPDALHDLQRRRALNSDDETITREFIEYTQGADSDLWMYIGATANTTDERKIEQYAEEALGELKALVNAGFRLHIRDGRVLAAASPREVDWSSIDAWAPQFAHVTRLSFTDDELCFEEGSSDVVAQLFERDEARGLTSVEFGGTGLSAAFGKEFATARLPNLVELRVYWEALRMEGLGAMAENASLESLKHLGLTFCGHDGAPAEPGEEEPEREFAAALGEAKFAGHLEELELKELFVSATFVQELVRHETLTRSLVHVDLSSDGEGWNCLGEQGVRALAKCETFDSLKSLHIANSEFPDKALVHLAVGYFPVLEILQIGWADREWDPGVIQTLTERFQLMQHS